MKKIMYFSLLLTLAFCINIVIPLQSSDEKEVTEKNVVIKVKKLADEIKGFKTFEVTAENQNDEQKTLNGKIYLGNSTVKQPKGGSGECTVYMEIPAKSKETKKFHCKEKASSDSWSFEIVKVYDF